MNTGILSIEWQTTHKKISYHTSYDGIDCASVPLDFLEQLSGSFDEMDVTVRNKKLAAFPTKMANITSFITINKRRMLTATHKFSFYYRVKGRLSTVHLSEFLICSSAHPWIEIFLLRRSFCARQPLNGS
jgi:hypothetical protein